MMNRKETMMFLNDKNAVEAVRSSEKFRKSNHCWNVQGYNKKRSIGYLMRLIEICKPKSLTDWIHFYLTDGAELEREMFENPYVYVKERGRSFLYLKGLARRFKNDLMDYSDIKISEDEAFKFVLMDIFRIRGIFLKGVYTLLIYLTIISNHIYFVSIRRHKMI